MMEEKKNQNPAGQDAAVEDKTEQQPKKQHYTRENLYSHIDLTIRQMDIIIATLFVLLAVAITVGIVVK